MLTLAGLAPRQILDSDGNPPPLTPFDNVDMCSEDEFVCDGVASAESREVLLLNISIGVGVRRFALLLISLASILTIRQPPAQAAEPKCDELGSIERRVQSVYEKAGPAVVRITEELEGAGGWSGVIATADGYVVTCAHHGEGPGERVFVHLADGRSVPARTLGSHESLDIALLKISVPGPWPHVKFGKSANMKPGDPCIGIGYPSIETPADEHTATIRMGRIVLAEAAPWMVVSSCRVKQGDSGGGLFDLEGRLIGVCSGSSALTRANTRHVGTELFERHWSELVETRRLTAPTPDEVGRRVKPAVPYLSRPELAPRLGLGRIEAAFHRSLQNVSPVAVEVLCDREQKVLGTVVGSDGWVLTKSSELFGNISVRLADGRELPAHIHGTLHEHDLALLKVSGPELPPIRWSRQGVPPPGTMVAALGCRQTAGSVGVVSHPTREVPPERGTLIASIQLQSSDPVPRVWELSSSEPFFANPFHQGDILRQVEGTPTPSFESLIRQTGGPDNGRFPGKIVGDRMQAVVERNGQPVLLRFQLAGLTSPSSGDLYPSGRYSGFPSVFSTDVFVLPEMCGGPLVDRSGNVVGIIISTANDEVQTYVIPAEVARSASRRLMKAERTEPPPTVASYEAPVMIRPARVGDAAPEFEVETQKGVTFRLGDQRGKLVVLCFWTMHSELCALELANLRTLYHQVVRDTDDCTMISLYTDPQESQPDFEVHTRKYKIDWPVAWIRSHSSISADYLTRHMQPCLVLVGPEGHILLRDHDVARFQAALTRVAAAKTSAGRRLHDSTDR